MVGEQVALEELQFPIGHFASPARIGPEDRLRALLVLAELPGELRNAVRGLDTEQLSMPYREAGWTLRQVVHHLADSHMNALLRIKLALTEEWPTIVPYNEAAWAALPDTASPIEWSLELVESLHARWVLLLQGLRRTDWQRGYLHPERGRQTVELATLLYAWHSRHHVAHIWRLRQRQDW